MTTDKTSIEDISIITAWPDANVASSCKAPTRIAYAAENPALTMSQDLWGYAVKPNMTSCSWTKLLLDTDVSNHDDPNIRAATDQGILHVPSNKKPEDVCADYLRHIYQHTVDTLRKQIGQSFLDATPMECWLTVPAVWSDRAQDLTKQAAQTAGFGSRPQDKVFVIPEPEAAAVTALKVFLKPRAPNSPSVGTCRQSR